MLGTARPLQSTCSCILCTLAPAGLWGAALSSARPRLSWTLLASLLSYEPPTPAATGAGDRLSWVSTQPPHQADWWCLLPVGLKVEPTFAAPVDIWGDCTHRMHIIFKLVFLTFLKDFLISSLTSSNSEHPNLLLSGGWGYPQRTKKGTGVSHGSQAKILRESRGRGGALGPRGADTWAGSTSL